MDHLVYVRIGAAADDGIAGEVVAAARGSACAGSTGSTCFTGSTGSTREGRTEGDETHTYQRGWFHWEYGSTGTTVKSKQIRLPILWLLVVGYL